MKDNLFRLFVPVSLCKMKPSFSWEGNDWNLPEEAERIIA
jgi:hypothetical protein